MIRDELQVDQHDFARQRAFIELLDLRVVAGAMDGQRYFDVTSIVNGDRMWVVSQRS